MKEKTIKMDGKKMFLSIRDAAKWIQEHDGIRDSGFNANISRAVDKRLKNGNLATAYGHTWTSFDILEELNRLTYENEKLKALCEELNAEY